MDVATISAIPSRPHSSARAEGVGTKVPARPETAPRTSPPGATTRECGGVMSTRPVFELVRTECVTAFRRLARGGPEDTFLSADRWRLVFFRHILALLANKDRVIANLASPKA